MSSLLRGGVAAVLAVAAGCGTDDGSTLSSPTLDQIQEQAKLVLPNNVPIPNAFGIATTISTNGGVDFSNPFFQDLGQNGRRCISCHLPTAGWTITPDQVQEIFAITQGGRFDDGVGLGAVFRLVDGSNSPTADVSTLAKKKAAYSMLLNKAVIRIGLPIPATAEFTLDKVDDPYGFASAAELSLFRRPLPTANLKFLSTVMWDGRENTAGQTIHFDLGNQASDAVTGHAQGDPIDTATKESIISFETAVNFAQTYSFDAGDLSAAGADGGPDDILAQEFHIGINDNFGDCIEPTVCGVIGAPLGSGMRGAPFTPVIFDIYDAWNNYPGNSKAAKTRASIARGQALFNSFPIPITGVGGLNDNPAFGSPAKLVGTCGTCHDSPNAGDHSVAAPLNIGLTDAVRRTKDMPLYTLKNKTTGATIQTTDPGRALITGKWIDIGKFKGPILRGLAARPPYFHNGFAKDLDAAIDFYNDRFNLKLTTQQHNDFVAFLRTL